MSVLNPDIISRLTAGWNSGKTVAQLQEDTGLSRQSVLAGLTAANIDPKTWRSRNRALGKSLGPVSMLKSHTHLICEAYGAGKSLAELADAQRTSRSSIRRALLAGGVPLRSRGRPVKQPKAFPATATI